MSAEGAAAIRPRTTGELLDDAWRFYFADAPALLLLSAVFLAPAFAAVVVLTGLPAPANPVLWLLAPLLPLALLVPTGLGSGACQEWLRARAEGRPPSFFACLAAAFRRGLAHAAARTLVLSIPLLVFVSVVTCVGATLQLAKAAPGEGCQPALGLMFRLVLLVVSGFLAFSVYPLLGPIHTFFASEKPRSWADLGDYFRLARGDPGKSVLVTLTRAALLVLAVVNLHLLVLAGLWVLDSLAGLDAAFVGLQLTVADPVYDLALVLFAWLLLAPFFETSNFLLHVDARSRQEGLDLQVRVQRHFPTGERRRVGALALLAGVVWLAAGPARAETAYDAAHAARQDVERVEKGVTAADSYDGAHWQDELERTADQLEQAGGRERFGWFRKAIEDVDGKPIKNVPKNDALKALGDLDDRLALLEETLPRREGGPPVSPKDDLKKRLQQPGGRRPVVQPEDEADRPKDQSGGNSKKAGEDQKPDDPQRDQKKPDDRQDQPKNEEDGRAHPALMGPGAVPGCGQGMLMLTAGLVLAVLLVGAVMFIASRKKGPPPARPAAVPAKTVQKTAAPHEPSPIERPVAELWREADELARNEKHLEAVRVLYLAVLSLLHRRQLLRFEPTRTNGEYIRQVRLAPAAPPPLHRVFQDFTNFFELKWYGDRACDGAEYRAVRKLAEEIEALVREV